VEDLKRELLGLLRKEMRPRDPLSIQRIEEIRQDPAIANALQQEHELIRRLAKEITGLCLIVNWEGPAALGLFENLMQDWEADPRWIREYPELYLSQFRHYQLAVQFGTLDPELLWRYQDRMPGQEFLPGPLQIEYERIRLSHLFSVGLNTGQLQRLYQEIPALLSFLDQSGDKLPAGTQLALLYNASLAFFVGEKWKESYSLLRRILEHPSKNARTDIRDLARILQLVLLYEMGDHDLNQYLSRSAKNYFRRHPRQWQFELAVARYIESCPVDLSHPEIAAKSAQLAEDLDRLQAESDTDFPLSGLTELRWWLKGKRENRSLQEVYRELVEQWLGQQSQKE